MKTDGMDSSAATKIMRKSRFAAERRRITQLKDDVNACSHWSRGKDVSAALDEALHDIDSLEERLDAKAVIAVVGGSGAGKSSIVNALCGREDTVVSGPDRPTTRKAAAIVRSITDADVILRNLGRDDVDVVPVPETEMPNAIIVDSPDTDSVECESYAGVLDKILDLADVLVCVFDAKNPIRRDNLGRLARSVAKFQSRHVVVVLNQADLLVPRELQDEVLPSFKRHLRDFWPGTGDLVFCTATPPKGAQRLPDGFSNQIGALVQFLSSVSGTAFVDERVSRAAFIRENAERDVRAIVRQQGDWHGLVEAICGLDARISQWASDRYSMSVTATMGCTDTDLVCAVTPRWWGPIGFYLGLSMRFRRFVEVPFSLYDLIPPVALIRRIKAVFKKDDRGDSGKDVEGDTVKKEIHIPGLESKIIQEYASLAEKMVYDFGMTKNLLDHQSSLDLSALSTSLHDSWLEARETELGQAAKRCSGVFFQLLLNGSFIVASAYVCWILGSKFLSEDYLPSVFYRHGACVLLFVWLLASWIVQVRLNIESRGISGRTERRFAAGDHAAQLLAGVADEVRILARIAS